ncbi:MAG: hypothetical protein JWO90_1378 [Solirubrobacterales bacterium]|jgi:hypothetical protein|nr:hypothetical protein [Solirubrobacterales bacterium]
MITTARTQDPEERRTGRIAGYVAYLATALAFAALLVALSTVEPAARTGPTLGGDDRGRELTSFDDSKMTALLSIGLRSLALALIVVVAVFLFKAVARRAPETPKLLLRLGIVAPLALALATFLGWLALSDVSGTFVGSGARTPERADQLVADSGLYRLTEVVQVLARLAFAVWVGLASSAAMRVGLLTRFLGYFGYGAAVAILLAPPAGDALLLGWLASLGALAANQWPGGRPEAWDTGEATAVDHVPQGRSA